MPKNFGLTATIFSKLILAAAMVLLITILGVDFLASRVARGWYIDMLTQQLTEKANMLAVLDGTDGDQIPRDRIVKLAEATSGRLTLIRRNGTVAVDSVVADTSHMENHRLRPEVQRALAGQTGSNMRKSATTGVEYLYVAVPAPGGTLRLAIPISELDKQVESIRVQMILAVAAAFLPVAVFAMVFARYISRRLGGIIGFAQTLAEGKFEERLELTGKDELSVLSAKLNETAGKLQLMFEELEHEKVELKRLERIRKDFVINVSHELRTPLASIQGYAETLLDGALQDGDNNVRFVNIIRQNAERLTSLTADLLTLSRIELKMRSFQLAGYYAARLLRDSVEGMQPIAERKEIELTMSAPPSDAEIFCDSEAFHQILSNLIDNAIKYTPHGGKVHVGAVPLTVDRQEMVRFWVTDSGVGIPKEDQPRLFERFYRVDKARSRELGGTGLGLAIVKHLVRAQGGEVWVDSEINKGSTFSFTLPVEDLGIQEVEDQPSKELTASS